jgi:voltage-gated potassium channel Kch
MSIDLGLFLRAPWLVLGIALGIVVLKFAILAPIARLFGYCHGRDAGLFAVALSQVGEFAFVLFTAAANVLPASTIAVLNAVVATSMLTTPLIMMLYQRYVLPRLEARAEPAADAIQESNPVIVAGFGRFGQVVVRVLRGLGIGATVIDHDPGQIDTVRRFGWKAYYGDATRLEVLESAGVANAKLLLVAIDDPGAAMQLVKRVRARFPALAIVVRARSRTDAYEYVEMGVPAVREVFGSALDAANRVLTMLSYSESEAESIIRRFKDYDEQQIVRNAPHRQDPKRLIELTEQGRRDIAELLAAEAVSAPQIDQNDAAGDGERRGQERGADRL